MEQLNTSKRKVWQHSGEVNRQGSYYAKVKKDFRRNKGLYLIVFPVVLYFFIFHYIPMYGALIAFKDFSPTRGFNGSDFVGIKHFITFFQSFYIWRLIRNTVLISIYGLLFGFPAPIILALSLNELRSQRFKRSIQTITYIPHFISMVVIAGIIVDFTKQGGIITNMLEGLLGYDGNLLLRKEYFRTIFVSSGIWQQVGWGSIIYLAALSGINPELYEAAKIDGAGRWRQTLNITIPGILPTIMILLILNVGSLMNVGFEKVMLLYNTRTYETADVISTFVYRKGILEAQFSYAAAVGLFNSTIACTLVILSNWISKKTTDLSLW